MCEIPNEVLYDNKMEQPGRPRLRATSHRAALLRDQGVSLGYCAQIAGMDKEDFIYFLGQNGVSVFHFDDEEMNNA